MASTKSDRADQAQPAADNREAAETSRREPPPAAGPPAGGGERRELRDPLGDYAEQTGAFFG